MRPFLSGSGTSDQRTRMLLEVVAKADTLVGPQEGTGKNKESSGVNICLNSALFAVYSGNLICHASRTYAYLACGYRYSTTEFSEVRQEAC